MEEYIRHEHEWLGRQHPAKTNVDETPPSQPTLDPESPQWHIIETFRDVLESKCQPRDAAERLANIILWRKEVLTAYSNMWGCFFSAVEHFSDIERLSILSNLLACLASLPGSINTSQDPFPNGDETEQHKKPVIIDGEMELFWKDLPEFSMNLGERMQGPEAYLSRGESDEITQRKWSNMNTFVAILVRDHGTTFPKMFGGCVIFAFTFLAATLEHAPTSRFGRNMALHMPAACRWILLASDAVWEALDAGCEGKPWTAMVGGFWKDQDGTSEVDGRRWAFWKYRFEALREDLRLDPEVADLTLQASRLM